MKILNTIGEKYSEGARGILESLGEVRYADISQDELGDIIGGYDAVVVGLGLNFSKDVLEKAENLKIIATATTGLDHIDLDAAAERRIKILSLRGEDDFLNTITGTAELAFGLAIDLLRFTPWAFDEVKDYEWNRENFRGHNLFGKTLGVVGMGRLGAWMARYGRAFGMEVAYADPGVSESPVRGCRKVHFDALLAESDIVSIHVHLDNRTENMFDARAFGKMKRSAYLINTSRGKIVNEDDLLAALEGKSIAGYATDVLAGELEFENTGFQNHPLVEYAKGNRNVIIVPHIGGMTSESRERTDEFIAEKMRDFLSG